MKSRIFTTSEKAWGAMLGAIEGAKRSVYLQMYILGDDDRGKSFFHALEDAAARGVHVIAILDAVGSLDFTSGAVSRLRAAGAEVLYCSFFFQRLHRKVLIIDESAAFVGGVNVGKKYARWRDLQIRVTGDRLLGAVLRSFSRIYRECGGEGEFARRNTLYGAARKESMKYVDHGVGKRRQVLRRLYEERIDKAQKSIELVTPYLFPPRWLIARLHQALIRGVIVEIIVPNDADHRLANTVNRSYASCLSNLGARCYFMPGMNHAKAMLIDRREGTIGSQNLDFLSFHTNIEAGVFFEDPAIVHELSVVFDEWKKEARTFNSRGVKFHWYDIPAAFFLRLFGFIPLE